MAAEPKLPVFDRVRNQFSKQHIVDAKIIIEVSSSIVYYCFAKPGVTNEDEGSYAIMKEEILTPSGIDSKTVRSWANGNQKFDKKASEYDTYTY